MASNEAELLYYASNKHDRSGNTGNGGITDMDSKELKYGDNVTSGGTILL